MKYLRFFLIFWTLFIAFGSIAGAYMMWSDPTGQAYGLAESLRLMQERMPFPDLLFRDLIPSGIVLLLVNGVPQFYASYCLIRRRPNAPRLALYCGLLLIVWILVEWYAIGFNPMANAFFLFGLIEAGLGKLLEVKSL